MSGIVDGSSSKMSSGLVALVFFGNMTSCIDTNGFSHEWGKFPSMMKWNPIRMFCFDSPARLLVYIDMWLCFDSNLVTIPGQSLVCCLIAPAVLSLTISEFVYIYPVGRSHKFH